MANLRNILEDEKKNGILLNIPFETKDFTSNPPQKQGFMFTYDIRRNAHIILMIQGAHPEFQVETLISTYEVWLKGQKVTMGAKTYKVQAPWTNETKEPIKRLIIIGKYIPDKAFVGLTSLKEVYAPNAKYIGRSAFSGCTSLREFEAPQAKRIGKRAFYKCSDLRGVALPKANIIGDEAFSKASSLNTLYLPSYHKGKINMPEAERIASGTRLQEALPILPKMEEPPKITLPRVILEF